MTDTQLAGKRRCESCKFWSEMIAQAVNGGPVEAVCLATGGQYSGQFTTSETSCERWEFDKDGAVDHPSRGDVLREPP